MPEDQIDARIEDKENRFLHLVTKSYDTTGPRIRKIRSVMMTWGRGQVVKVAPFDQDDNMRQTQDNKQMENVPEGLEKNKIIADAVTEQNSAKHDVNQDRSEGQARVLKISFSES